VWYNKDTEREVTNMSMKKTYIINDREFECIVSSTFNTCAEVTVKTVRKFLGRKCLKTFGYGSFNPRQFGSIDKGVVSVIQKLIDEKDREEREIKKWKNFEKTLDKPYIM
jgi:hypothetical protein